MKKEGREGGRKGVRVKKSPFISSSRADYKEIKGAGN